MTNLHCKQFLNILNHSCSLSRNFATKAVKNLRLQGQAQLATINKCFCSLLTIHQVQVVLRILPLLVPPPALVVKGLAHGDRPVLGASVHTNPGRHLSQHHFLDGLRRAMTVRGSRAEPVGVRASQTGLTLYPTASHGRVTRFVTTSFSPVGLFLMGRFVFTYTCHSTACFIASIAASVTVQKWAFLGWLLNYRLALN